MKSSGITLLHNPRCGKSRSALALLQEKGVEPQIIEYLKTPPTREELKALLHKLNLDAEQIVRKGEEIYRQHYAGKSMSGENWLDALVAHPILLERPIAVKGDRAVVGRPPENVLRLL
jgi:arsenate reductase